VNAPHAGLDETHDPQLSSWVESANAAESDFPVQNLPLGVFQRAGSATGSIGVAIGDQILDLAACARAGLLEAVDPPSREACGATAVNALAALGADATRRLRRAASQLLRDDTREGDTARAQRARLMVPAAECTMLLPAAIGDYTDFYASLHHASNVGALFRPDNPLLPNYKWVPIGYHGRASSLVVSGTPVVRPRGQTRADATAPPVFGPTHMLDYELEVGAFIGRSTTLGAPVPLARAGEHVFGLCLVNDWSARDIQSWEYQPLGPFLAKSFATSVSPWVVTTDALSPFRVPLAARPAGDPRPLAYLDDAQDAESGAFDITLEVWLHTAAMRTAGAAAARISRGTFRDMYWTLGQLLAHHTSNGCNLRTGDLLASGTVSNAAPESRGCLLERTSRGREPVALPGGETRSFLADGDEVILRGWCERSGFRRVGFGECRGVVLPAASE
jgi:fumarylacetoacetase